jgi:hypothetical protein
MIQNYIKGAFGLSDIAVTEQTGLDAWMWILSSLIIKKRKNYK